MTAFQLYEYLFMTELIVAGMLFSHKFVRRKLFPVRLAGALALCYLSVLGLTLTGAAGTGWQASLIFLAMFAVFCAALVFIYETSLKGLLFSAIAAYTAQHLAYEIFKLIFTQFNIFIAQGMYGDDPLDLTTFDASTVVAALVYVNIYLGVYALVYFVIGRKIGDGKNLRLKSAGMFVLSGAILLIDVLLNAVVVYIVDDYNKLYDNVASVYNILCCVLVFYVQYNILFEKNVVGELEVVSELLAKANRQYAMRKEEIDLINMKCHDIKHLLNTRRGTDALDEKTYAEMNEIVSMYDASVKTGNDVIDLILTDKSILCRSKNIRITCIADCSNIGFMANGDLYALFGNIIDNAVEAVGAVDDECMRCIGVNIHEVSGWISIMVENYFNGTLCFTEDGLPATKKQDSGMHGYGLRSVRHIAEKYGGNMAVETCGNIFRISVILPVKADGNMPAGEGSKV